MKMKIKIKNGYITHTLPTLPWLSFPSTTIIPQMRFIPSGPSMPTITHKMNISKMVPEVIIKNVYIWIPGYTTINGSSLTKSVQSSSRGDVESGIIAVVAVVGCGVIIRGGGCFTSRGFTTTHRESQRL